jgi:hypothetical protein
MLMIIFYISIVAFSNGFSWLTVSVGVILALLEHEIMKRFLQGLYSQKCAMLLSFGEIAQQVKDALGRDSHNLVGSLPLGHLRCQCGTHPAGNTSIRQVGRLLYLFTVEIQKHLYGFTALAGLKPQCMASVGP